MGTDLTRHNQLPGNTGAFTPDELTVYANARKQNTYTKYQG